MIECPERGARNQPFVGTAHRPIAAGRVHCRTRTIAEVASMTRITQPKVSLVPRLCDILGVVSSHRRLRVRLIGMLSIVLLFSQLAVAVYACPAMSGKAAAGATDMAGMPCAQMMAAGAALDAEQPTLCMQHCQFGSVSHMVDHMPAVFLSATALPPTLTVPADEDRGADHRSWAENERLRDRPPPLSHSIAHCCYRI